MINNGEYIVLFLAWKVFISDNFSSLASVVQLKIIRAKIKIWASNSSNSYLISGSDKAFKGTVVSQKSHSIIGKSLEIKTTKSLQN